MSINFAKKTFLSKPKPIAYVKKTYKTHQKKWANDAGTIISPSCQGVRKNVLHLVFASLRKQKQSKL
jgi:hypothetical protein